MSDTESDTESGNELDTVLVSESAPSQLAMVLVVYA